MNRIFRKYHRILAMIICLPLLLTLISGVAYTILNEWVDNESLSEFLLGIHTMEIVHLERIYPVLNGIGVLGLLVTGLTMTGFLQQKSVPRKTVSKP
jgi:hypothetical protein